MVVSVSGVDPAVILVETREELTRADGKASTLLAALGVAISVIGGSILAGSWTPHRLEHAYRIVWWIGVGFGASGSVALCAAVWPRIKHRLEGPAATYFDDIALLGDIEKVKKALAQTTNEERTLVQLITLSKIARRKYMLIRWALALLALATVLVVLAATGGS